MKLSRSLKQWVSFFLPGSMIFLYSCSKSSFLDKRTNSDLVIPTTLADFQALLDNDAVFGVTPALGELSADNFYLDYSLWLPLDAKQHNAYIWAPDIYNGQGQVEDWNFPYQQVFYANVVLDGLPKVTVDSTNINDWKAVKGAALFSRAYAFFNVAQLFAPMYDVASASTDSAIPLRLDPDINKVSTRATVEATYDTILHDLNIAKDLLPIALPFANRNRPSKPAALAMLARVYLSMRDYVQAGKYADSCLLYYSALIDYNTLSPGAILPFKLSNDETLYQSRFPSSAPQILTAFVFPGCLVDTELYRSYASDDLRRQFFYQPNGAGYANINGSYNGSIYPFSGLATDEVYLVRAECRARAGDQSGALADLNTLMAKRWKSGSFTPFTAGAAEEALDTILLERRKELAFRGLRWTDLRRSNKEGANITLRRNLDGQSYQLAPNSLLYVLPIPPDVITLSGMTQKPRPEH